MRIKKQELESIKLNNKLRFKCSFILYETYNAHKKNINTEFFAQLL